MLSQVHKDITKEADNFINSTIKMQHHSHDTSQNAYSFTNDVNQSHTRDKTDGILQTDSKNILKNLQQYTQNSQTIISGPQDFVNEQIENSQNINQINDLGSDSEYDRRIREDQDNQVQSEEMQGQGSTRGLTYKQDNEDKNGQINSEQEIYMIMERESNGADEAQIKRQKKRPKATIKQQKLQRFTNYESDKQSLKSEEHKNNHFSSGHKQKQKQGIQNNAQNMKEIQSLFIDQVIQSGMIQNQKYFLLSTNTSQKIMVSYQNMQVFFPNTLHSFYQRLISNFNRQQYMFK